jgi:hypothetical protein
MSSPAGVIDGQISIAKLEQVEKVFCEKIKACENIITSSPYFKKFCTDAFQAVDSDNSGTVDSKECYVAVLRLYLKIADFVPGLIVPEEALIKDTMTKMGKDALNCDEFLACSKIVLGDITSRVAVQAFCTLILFPVIASFLVRVYCFFFPPHWLLGYIIPSSIPIIVISSVLATLFIPKILAAIDVYFHGK